MSGRTVPGRWLLLTRRCCRQLPTARRGRGSCRANTRSTREKPGGHKGSGGLSRVLVVGLGGVLLRAQVSAVGSGESGSLLNSRK